MHVGSMEDDALSLSSVAWKDTRGVGRSWVTGSGIYAVRASN